MADTYALSDAPGAGSSRQPEDRGSLDVRARAIVHLVESAVLRVDGVVVQAGAFDKLRRTRSPRAEVSLHGSRARVQLEVAAAWPCSVTELATRVRDHVLAEATRMSGIDIESLDVTLRVTESSRDDGASTRRRVR